MTQLKKYFDMTNDGELYPTRTRDTWTILDTGAEIWCTAWKRGQTIKPYGDGCHVVVGLGDVYHCDQLMGIMQQLESEGARWGISGVEMQREQNIGGHWTRVQAA